MSASTEESRRWTRGVVALISAIAIIAIVALVWTSGGSDDNSPEASAKDTEDSSAARVDPSPDQSPADVDEDEKRREYLRTFERRDSDDVLARGPVDAPVVMVMYSDYRCPFCAKFSKDTEPALVDRYVKKGKLRIEWRDTPFFGDQSVTMAHAGRAAARQGKFWEFNEAAYAVGDGSSKPSFPEARIREVARDAGVPDLKKFDADRTSKAIAKETRTDLAEAESIGVTSTPAFLIDGEPLLGAQPVEQFASMIEAALKR